jgi:hypothetical protein
MEINEVWKDIKGYDKLYQVSNDGKVCALERLKNCNKGYRKINYHIMTPNIFGTKYERVGLTNSNGIRKYYLVHRLVAQAFIPNPNNYPIINHIDGNKLNNNVSNLEWCTYSHNLKHAYSIGLKEFTKEHKEKLKLSQYKRFKKVFQYDLQNNFIKEYESIKEASDIFKINPSNIVSCCKGNKYKSVGGYIWKYANAYTIEKER